MEPRFGHDFSKVRIHADTRAAESAQAVNSLAYTVGNNMVFGSGRYTPDTEEGRRLLGHELTHVLQQSSSSGMMMQRTTYRGAGGCAPVTEDDEDDSGPKNAGLTAHRQIQTYLFPAIWNEIRIPRATKTRISSPGCQPPGTEEGRADLLRVAGLAVNIAEIKPVRNDAMRAVNEARHYQTRARQSLDRQFGFGRECPGQQGDAEDERFTNTISAQEVIPPTIGMISDILPTDTYIGQFVGDPARTLKARLMAPGAVGYWCTGGRSDTYICPPEGAAAQVSREYLDRVLGPAQGVLQRVLEEWIEIPMTRALERFSARQLLELGERYFGSQLRDALRPYLGPLADPIISRANAQELGDYIDQHLGPVAQAIVATLAREFISRLVNELRLRLRDSLEGMVRGALVALCVGVPVITLDRLLNELERQIRLQMRQLIPVAATAVALSMVAEVAAIIQRALSGIGDIIMRALALVALVLLAAAVLVVGILAIASIFDPIPGDEVLLGGAEAFLYQLLRSCAQYVFHRDGRHRSGSRAGINGGTLGNSEKA
jgi:hypothetical protein